MNILLLQTLSHANNMPEKRIVVIIPSFNNAFSYQANLLSVINQEYENYHIIYIDDASPDGTGQLVQQFIIDNNIADRITFIGNEYNRKALANMYKAFQYCQPSDIILELDGDDALASNQLLKNINELFSTQDVWLAYAQYKNVPEHLAKENKISVLGYTKPTPPELIASREFRTKWFWSGLRMYYAWLVKNVKLEDLILPNAPYNGKFFPTSKDGALVYPMLEMSGPRIKHIPDVWLLRNIDTPLNDYKIARDLQLHCGKTLKESPHYDLLEHPTVPPLANDQEQADLLIFADGCTQSELSEFITSCHQYARQLGNVYMLHSQDARHYDWLRRTFPELIFIHIPDDQNAAPALEYAMHTMNDQVILSDGRTPLAKEINLSACINSLHDTYAYGFYLQKNLSSFGDVTQLHLLPCEQIIDTIYAWKFNCFMPNEFTINNIGMTLYRTTDIQQALANMNAQSLDDIANQWKQTPISLRKIGLFFE